MAEIILAELLNERKLVIMRFDPQFGHGGLFSSSRLARNSLVRSISFALIFTLIPPGELSIQVSVILLALGAFIGVWGSTTSLGRFLKIYILKIK